jgi:hypothetical protein
MTEVDWSLFGWILNGVQRNAVIRAMEVPNTITGIYKIARKDNPRKDGRETLSREYVGKIVRAFIKRGLARCLSKDLVTGNIYALTEKGQATRKELLRKPYNNTE